MQVTKKARKNLPKWRRNPIRKKNEPKDLSRPWRWRGFEMKVYFIIWFHNIITFRLRVGFCEGGCVSQSNTMQEVGSWYLRQKKGGNWDSVCWEVEACGGSWKGWKNLPRRNKASPGIEKWRSVSSPGLLRLQFDVVDVFGAVNLEKEKRSDLTVFFCLACFGSLKVSYFSTLLQVV